MGIPLEGTPGPLNAITDLPGIEVGYTTLIEVDSIRTGVTILHPRGKENHDPVFGGWFAMNGNGELTGAAWLEEGGFLEGPIGLTNTHSVGVVRDAIIAWQEQHKALFQMWSLPLVTETADGWLSDMYGQHVQAEHAWAALDGAQGGPLAEGNVGGGTGMICYEFKGGTGTASRKLPDKFGGYTVGALVQANFGRRFQLSVAGVPIGQHLTENAIFTSGENPFRETGSSGDHPGDGRPAAALPAQAAGPAGRHRHGTHRRHGGQRLGRPVPGLFDCQPWRSAARRAAWRPSRHCRTTAWIRSSWRLRMPPRKQS